MPMQLAIYITLVIIGLSIMQPLAANIPPPLTKSINCKEKCGNVTIPFPFGIGTGCFLSVWYEIDCQENGTLPILKKINLEVLDIFLSDDAPNETPTITVKLPTFDSNSTNCTGNRANAPVSLEGSHFFFSKTRNIFTAIGCDVLSVMDDTKSAVVGCKSSCVGGSSSMYSNCTGVDDCCHTDIPDKHQIYSPSFTKKITKASGDDEECEYAFLVDECWLGHDKINLSALKVENYLPAVLEWGIPRDTDVVASYYPSLSSQNVSYVCYHYGPTMLGSMRCYCDNGYKGNPYLINGCKDIDECEDSLLNTCPGRCVNQLGTFHCMDRARPLKHVAIGTSGAAWGAILLFVLLCFLWQFTRRRKEAKQKERFFKNNGGLLLQQQLSSFEGNLQKCKIFSSNELKKATDNFNESRILGKGGQGTVYKGVLTNGNIVAIKKAMVMTERNMDIFINEVIILSQINHRNVVKLLGCCLETKVPLLVYEFIPNGTLYHYIQNPTEFSMSWDMRLRIASDVAGALAYLHSSASMPIYHRDIKSTNILLDDMYRPKVADFGTSKLVSVDQTHVTTIIQGTFGYLDPEFFRSSQFTDKSDVYSFGVVIVELLTGQKPVNSLLASEGKSLAMHFIQSMEEDHLPDILDAKVMEQGNKEDIIDVANLAKRCLNSKGRDRPTMKEVAQELERIKKKQHLSNIQLEANEKDEQSANISISEQSEKDAECGFISQGHALLPRNTW